MPDATDASEWFVVHPAFDHPRPAADYWLGVVESDIEGWLSALDEEAQEAELRASWRRVSEWAIQQGADRIIADVEREFVGGLGRAGFLVDRHISRLVFTGGRAEMMSALDCATQVPRLNLVVYRGDIELLQVRNMSWDSVFARFGLQD